MVGVAASATSTEGQEVEAEAEAKVVPGLLSAKDQEMMKLATLATSTWDVRLINGCCGGGSRSSGPSGGSGKGMGDRKGVGQEEVAAPGAPLVV